MKLSSLYGSAFGRAFFLLSLLPAGAQAAQTLQFEKVFNSKAEPLRLYYEVTYQSGGKQHQLKVWRYGSEKLRKITDDAIETIVSKPRNDQEWKMVVLDLQRKIRTDVDRTNLIRIGGFFDWFSLSHGLRKPGGDYFLEKLTSGHPENTSGFSCQWYQLKDGTGQVSQICWSQRYRLPVQINDASNAVIWRIITARENIDEKKDFLFQDKGFIHHSANEDISTD